MAVPINYRFDYGENYNKKKMWQVFFARQHSTLEKHCLQIFCKARDGYASSSMRVPRNKSKKSRAIDFSYVA